MALHYWNLYHWWMLAPILAWTIGARSPVFFEHWFKGTQLGKQKRCLWWGSIFNVVSCLFYLAATVFERDVPNSKRISWFCYTVGALFGGLAYMSAYNGQYQYYLMTKPIFNRYMQASECGIPLFCCFWYWLLCIKFGAHLATFTSVSLGSAVVGGVAAILVAWTEVNHYRSDIVEKSELMLHATMKGAEAFNESDIVTRNSDFRHPLRVHNQRHNTSTPRDQHWENETKPEKRDYEHDKFVNWYMLIFLRCCVESTGSAMFFFIIPMLRHHLPELRGPQHSQDMDNEALVDTIKAFALEYVVQWLSIWYATSVLRNNNPFWYTMFFSLFAYIAMWRYAHNPCLFWVFIWFAMRRCFITFHVHGINLTKIEEIYGTPYRKGQYTAHWVTQFLVAALMIWLVRVLVYESNVESLDLTFMHVLLPGFWIMTFVSFIGVPASAY